MTLVNQKPKFLLKISKTTLRNADVFLLTIVFLLLPYHILLLTLLTKAAVPSGIISLVTIWKEVLLFVAALWVAVRRLSRNTILRCNATDLVILLYVIIGVWYSIGSIDSFFLGARNVIFFTGIPYLLGRQIVYTLNIHTKLQNAFLLTGAIAAISGLVEWHFLPRDFWAQIGLTDYFSSKGFVFTGLYGIPYTFFNSRGEYRVGGISAGPLELSTLLAILIAVPIALLITRNTSRIKSIILVACMISAAYLTGSRTNFAVLLFVVVAILLATKPRLIFPIALGLCVFVCFELILPAIGVLENSLLYQSITFQESSSNSHLLAWQVGWDSFVQNPWGYGFGNAGAASTTRLGREALGGESVYVIMLVDLGIIGFPFFVASIFAALLVAIRCLWRGRNHKSPEFVFACTAFAAIAVNVLVGLTAEGGPLASVFCWFFCGLAVTQLSKNRKFLIRPR